MGNTIRIAIADNHSVFVEELAKLLNSLEDFWVIHTAGNGKDLLSQMKHNEPDVVLLDISMPILNGFETTLELKRHYPRVRIIFLTMYDKKEYIDRAEELGADGYLLKEQDSSKLIDMIRKIISSDKPHCLVRDNEPMLHATFPDTLTKQETEILKLLAGGMPNHEISKQHVISEETIEGCRNDIMKKLNLKTTADLINYAIQNKLIDLDSIQPVDDSPEETKER